MMFLLKLSLDQSKSSPLPVSLSSIFSIPIVTAQCYLFLYDFFLFLLISINM